jgi:hypothetical protein
VKKLKEELEFARKANNDVKLAASPPITQTPYQPAGSPQPREHELIKDLENNIRFLTAELEHTSLLVVEKDNIIKQMQQRAPQVCSISVCAQGLLYGFKAYQLTYPLVFKAFYEDIDSRSVNDDMIMQLHEKKKEKQRLEMELIDARTNMRKLEEERNRLNTLLTDRTQRFDDYHETKTVSIALRGPIHCFGGRRLTSATGTRRRWASWSRSSRCSPTPWPHERGNWIVRGN